MCLSARGTCPDIAPVLVFIDETIVGLSFGSMGIVTCSQFCFGEFKGGPSASLLRFLVVFKAWLNLVVCMLWLTPYLAGVSPFTGLVSSVFPVKLVSRLPCSPTSFFQVWVRKPRVKPQRLNFHKYDRWAHAGSTGGLLPGFLNCRSWPHMESRDWMWA